MKNRSLMVWSFLALLTLPVSAFSNSAETAPLDDLMTPDEIAAEAGIPFERLDSSNPDPFFDYFKAPVPSANFLQHPGLVIVINKAPSGEDAQTLRVFRNGELLHTMKTSTGREQLEVAKSGRKYWTVTPVGYFRPVELKPNHYSNTWRANMPWTIFFIGGIAIHATTESHYAELGTRASGGCVRLTLENAKTVYDLVQGEGMDLVPAYTRNGEPLLNTDGSPKMIQAHRTLIIVEDPTAKTE